MCLYHAALRLLCNVQSECERCHLSWFCSVKCFYDNVNENVSSYCRTLCLCESYDVVASGAAAEFKTPQ